MKTNPHFTDEELKPKAVIWPNGEYSFEVIEAKEGESKQSGNAYIRINMKLYDDQGNWKFQSDFLMATLNTEYRFRHFCRATGLEGVYAQGRVTAQDCERATGKLRLGYQGPKHDDRTGKDYEERNVVKDYVVPEHLKPKTVGEMTGAKGTPGRAAAQTDSNEELSQDIPF